MRPKRVAKANPHRTALTAFAYIGAALSEIVGCFAFWAWLQMGKSAWWTIPGMMALAFFADLPALVEAGRAGRTYAAYGGVCIVSAIGWLWLMDGAKPDRWDLFGAAVCLGGGAAIILFGPRAAWRICPPSAFANYTIACRKGQAVVPAPSGPWFVKWRRNRGRP